MKRPFIAVLIVAFSLVLSLGSVAEARRTRRSTSSSQPRPATGFGANLHRRYIIQRELDRARSGKSVRNRGNIMWRR